ncbi:DUF1287 domain-containing protein [Sphingomonas sp. SUN039]|uniref:DUF1287 domain-containing protein n=1 Tax=Sphingomonas sp. SUN039 TaxID=2937787 RepID=UPI002164BEC5|nr:DUF1287 domain-containing protein [Sphingomonas sp. SUN039]UVO55471.1 DUF1287 domain-containing protein [Sphingomonas sp. SUN039]
MFDRRTFLAGCAALAGCGATGAALPASPRGLALVAAARRQIGITLSYDPAYTRIAFPGGDVARSKGVCTDVVIRAYRDAFAIDLQARVNADMRRAFGAYPKKWGLRAPDANIDHRRVPNLETFLRRQRAARPLDNPADFLPGDIVTMRVNRNLPHIGIVSDRLSLLGRPLVIHNIGSGTREEDAISAYPPTYHFRWLPA